MSNLLFLPILIPLLSGALCLACWRSTAWQKRITLLGSFIYLFITLELMSQTLEQGYLVLQMGNWPAPFGISLVADVLSAIMVVLTGIVSVAAALYSMASVPNEHIRFGYFPLLHFLLVGVTGAFLTGDIFNLFVWFEVMLLSSFGLLTLGGERAQMEGAIKYVTINLFSSAIFLTAVGLLYGMAGSLNLADLAVKLPEASDDGMVNVLAILFMASFGIKAGVFPLFFWLPASYHTPLVAVSAVFAGLLTKVGVYALYRVFSLLFVGDVDFTHTLLLWIGVLTMVTGVLGAAAQFEFRRILSFHIISQIGYMILALAIFTPLALVGGVFYIMHHILVKTNLFLISGLTYHLTGTHELGRMGGVYRHRPWLAVGFLVSAMSLAGLPPLSGFFAKFVVIKAGVEAGSWWATGFALLVGLLTLYSMIKIWGEVFWKKADAELKEEVINKSMSPWMLLPVIMLAAMTVSIGVWGEPLLQIAELAADQLLNRSGYIDAVLGAER
ncbi:MAG: Na+/H+ antiporter subunit D [Pseudomonadales bacterium]|nr:Na+/H+ antiporter subunit D [Pseudomonadales bacterium]